MGLRERTNRNKAINLAIKNLEKQLKKEGVCQVMGDKDNEAIERFPSGSIALDVSLGGGIPLGRVIEFFGYESSGKSLIATKAMAEVQKLGGTAALIDFEMSFEPNFARKLGLNPDELIISQPETMEDGFTVIEALAESNAVDLIVLDSIASMVPKAEFDAEIGKQNIALQARGLSQFLRKLIGICAKTGCTVICINQMRDNVGVMYGDPTTTPGGRALKFYSSIRVKVSKMSGGKIEKKLSGGKTEVIGQWIKCTVQKNKTATPFRTCEFPVYFDGRRPNIADELAEIAIENGLIPKFDAAGNLSPTGRTYRLEIDGEVLLAKKRDDVRVELAKCPKVQNYLLELIRSGKYLENAEGEEISEGQEDNDYETMTDDEFLNNLTSSDAEEIENNSWDNV